MTFLPYFQETDVELDYTWFELYEENGGKTHVGQDGAKVAPVPSAGGDEKSEVKGTLELKAMVPDGAEK